MKKIMIYSSLMLALSINNQAQTLFNNGGFETWTNATGYNEPEHWFSLNRLVTFNAGYTESTVSTFDTYAGTQAALLISQENMFQNIPGVLSSGSLFDEEGNPDLSNLGTPYTNRPTSFEFYYKYLPAPGDSAIAYVLLTKWNATAQKRDTIALGEFIQGDSVKSYVKKEVNLTYSSTAQPDSIVVFFSTSYDGFDPQIGSQLFIDEFRMNFSVGINKVANSQDMINVYPNPSTGVVYITSNDLNASINIYDINGKMITSVKSNQQTTQLSTSAWSPGIYMVEVIQGEKVSRSRLIVQ